MPIDAELDKLSSSLMWMENKVGVNWSSTEKITVDRAHGWSIEGRRHLAIAAIDNDCEEFALNIGSPFLAQKTDWESSHPASWYAKMKYLVDDALQQGQKAVGKKAWHYQRGKRKEFADQIFDSLIPEIDFFVVDPQVLRLIGETKTMNLWARAYSIAAWAQRETNPDRAFSLLEKLAGSLNEFSTVRLNIKDAAAFALGSVIHRELPPSTAIMAWNLVKEVFSPEVDPVDSHKWRVSAAAELGRLSFFLPEDERQLALRNMRALVACWDDECLQDNNGIYAINNVIEAMIGYADAIDRQQLATDDQELLVAMIRKPTSMATKVAGIDSIIQKLPKFLSSVVLMECCQSFIHVLPSLTNPQEHVSVTRALCLFARHAGGDVLENTWEAICQSGPVDQLVWLFHLHEELQYASGYQYSSVDIAGLQIMCRYWGKDVADQLKIQWLKAVIQTASKALLTNDSKTLQQLADGFQSDNALDQLARLVIMSIVPLGSASSEQLLTWARQVIDVPLSQNIPQLTVAKASALSVLCRRSGKIDSYVADLMQTELDRLAEWNTPETWVKDILDENAQDTAEQLFLDWQTSRWEITAKQTHRLLCQLMGLECRASGSAIVPLLRISHWLLRHPGKVDQCIAGDIENIHQLGVPTAASEIPPDFVVFQFLTGKDKHLVTQLLQGNQEAAAGHWTEVKGEETGKLLTQLFPIDGFEYQENGRLKVVTLSLPWYENVQLFQLSNPDWRNAHVYFLSFEDQYYRLDGKSDEINQVNAKGSLKLRDEYVLDYLRFFTFFVHGGEGPFYILESPDDVLLPADLNDADRESICEHAKPAVLHGLNNAGQFFCEATIYYGKELFNVDILVDSSGMIEMLDDHTIGQLSVNLDCPIILHPNQNPKT